MLVLQSDMQDLKASYEALGLWGFCYIKTTPTIHRKFLIVGSKGDAPEINFPKRVGGMFPTLTKLPGAKISVNAPYKKKDWEIWRKDFSNVEDMYRFPIRKNFIEIDPQVLFLSYQLRKYTLQGKEWRWQIGDTIATLVAMGIPVKSALDFAEECTGYSISSLDDMWNMSKTIPRDKRNYARSWASYREELGRWKRSRKEVHERAATTPSRMGYRRSKSVENDV